VITVTASPDDDRLLAELAAALTAGQDESGSARAAGAAAWSWRTVDAELAALVHDSWLDAGALVRSEDADARMLSFSGTTHAVELDITADAVVGQVLPPSAGTATLERADGAVHEAAVDELGAFTLPGAAGLARVRVVTATGAVTTDWVRL
jgi:hypothetical protein